MKRKQPGCKGFDLDYNSISEEYLKGVKLKELAEKYNVSVWTLLDRFGKIGVKKHINRFENENVFGCFTPESCYWSGFLAADGNIRKNVMSCELSAVDVKHLEKLRLFLQSNAKISERVRVKNGKEFKYCSINFNNKNLIDILKNNFNLIPKKSLVLLPPDKIPNELVKHYIRGYIDGDGCIGWSKSNKTVRLNICSGSIELLSWMNVNLKTLYEIGNPKIRKVGKKTLYTIDYSKNIVSVLEDLYGSGERLERKYNKYLELKEKLKEIENKKEEKRFKNLELYKKIIELFNNNISYEEMAEKLNCSIGKIIYSCGKMKIKRNKGAVGKNKKIKERNGEIIKLFNEGISAKELSEKYSISKNTIWKVVKESKGV